MFYRFCMLLLLVFMTTGIHAGEVRVQLNAQEQEYLAHKKVITMCVDPDWEPFEIINTEGKHEGIAADLIQLVAKRAGVHIKLIQTKTWDETLILSKSGQCDILSFLNQTPEREKWLTFTEPLLTDPNILITREEHPYIADLYAQNHESVVLPAGTAMLERMSKDFKNLKFIPVVSEPEAMEMVSDRRADMTVRSLIVAAYIINKEGWFNLKISGQPLGYENHLRIGVLKNQPILRDILNKAIATITPIERETIINQHTGLTVQEGINYKTVIWIVVALLVLVGFITLWNTLLHKKVRTEVSKNLRIKEQFMQSAKQAEIGNLIANISHQWREPLSKLSSVNLLLIAKIRSGHTIENEWLLKQSQDVENTIDFMSQTMQNFLEFYKQSDKHTSFSLVESINATLFIIETRILDNKITVDIRGEDIWKVEGIKNEWMQIWLNLLNNAVHILRERKIADPMITITVGDGYVHFCDNGGGLRSEESFGGLGLPMCREIVAKYGARLELKNSDEGLCIIVVLRSFCDIERE